jgi:5-methyltetrahydropteroyltriglutamate--homocysteine methyltransferase
MMWEDILMTVKNKPPFRYDIVGSFLRPAALKEKREALAAGTITAADLKAAEDEAIRDLLAKEKEVGLRAVTDGEFRRRYWHLDFLTELEGVTEISAENWSVHFKGAQPKARTAKITGPISFGSHPFLDHFRFLKEAAGDTLAKMTIPSPSMLHLICCVREKHYEPIPQYQDQNRLFTDIALAYQQAIRSFYAAGCRYLQLDDTSWGEFCDADKRKAYAERGFDLDELANHYVDMINRALEAKPEDMTITMHICRGNFRSTWFSSGGGNPLRPLPCGRILPGIRQRPGRRLRTSPVHQRPAGGPGPGDLQDPGTGKGRRHHRPDPGSGKIRTPGPAVPESPVRFLLHRRREPADGKRTVGQAPADPVHCGKSLGRCVKTGL